METEVFSKSYENHTLIICTFSPMEDIWLPFDFYLPFFHELFVSPKHMFFMVVLNIWKTNEKHFFRCFQNICLCTWLYHAASRNYCKFLANKIKQQSVILFFLQLQKYYWNQCLSLVIHWEIFLWKIMQVYTKIQ